MNKIITTIMLLFIVSCGNKGLATDPQKVEIGDFYTLKLTTLLYEDDGIGIGNSYHADDLVQISLGIGGVELEQKVITALNEGIKIPTDSKVAIEILPAYEEEEIQVLWLGSSLKQEYWNSKEIELDINTNTTLTLVVAKGDKPITPAFIYLNVKGTGLGGKVLVNDNVYGEGEHEILSLSGLKASFEALLPEDDVEGNIEFLAFDSHMGRETSKTMDIIVSGDTAVTATFYNKNDIKGTITISLAEDYIEKVTIKINGEAIKKEQYALYNNEVYNYTMPPQAVGTKISLTAETKDPDVAKFVSWTDDVSGYLGNQALDYKYTVTEYATITPVFSKATGVLTVAINPKTNWADHRMNQVQYTIIRGGTTIVTSTENGSTHKNLTHNNNIISDIEAGDIVELKAIQGEGFYPNDTTGTNVKWSGDISGTGIRQTITFNTGASKSQVVDFKREDRVIRVSIDKYKTVTTTVGGTDTQKEASTNDAGGHSIIINGTTYNSSVVSAVFPWHTKVKVEIKPGTHYTEEAIYNGADSLENAYNSGKGINPKYDSESNPTTLLTYDLENNVTNLVKIHHDTVEMTQIMKGGSFSDLSADDLAKYRASVNITGTGDNVTEGIRIASTYSKDGVNFSAGTSAQDSIQKFKVLSGVRVNIAALTTVATAFVNHSITANASYMSSTSSTTPTASVSNNGGDFTVTTTFKSPISELKVTPRAFTNASATTTESDDLKATPYQYKIKFTGDIAYNSENTFKLTNGIPVKLTAIPNDDYDVLSLGGVKGIIEKDITITNNTSTNVDFLHKIVKNKLVITGGKDDKHTSYVEVSGTGLSSGSTRYEAKYRNMIYDSEANIQKIAPTVTNEFNSLSGINNKLKIAAITSKVHNFGKIRSENISDIPAVILNGSTSGGIRTYNSTNVATATKTLSVDGGTIIVEFRINSLGGGLSGITGIDALAPDHPVRYPEHYTTPPKTEGGITYYTIYDAYDLYRVRFLDSYHSVVINLDNDIYLGDNGVFDRLAGDFRGTFNGNNHVIYDPKLDGNFIYQIDKAQIKGLTLARGSIYSENNNNIGVIGVAGLSKIEYITNATRSTSGKNNVGGIIGNYAGESSLSYLVNYSTVNGNNNVGGIIGYHTADIGQNNYYFANYGEVNGANYVGGIIGHGFGEYDVSKRHYYIFNKGNVNATGSYAGGIIGLADWGALEIYNFYNTGKVYAQHSGSGGIAGLLRGYRKQNGGGQMDTKKTTHSLNNGYNIGRVEGPEASAIVARAGYKADEGEHYIVIDEVYSHRILTSPIMRYIYSGVPNLWAENKGSFPDSFNNPVYTTFKTTRGEVGGGDWQGMHKIVSIESLSTTIKGFKDANVWVQSAMPDINGYDARPTFKNLPETVKPTLDK